MTFSFFIHEWSIFGRDKWSDLQFPNKPTDVDFNIDEQITKIYSQVIQACFILMEESSVRLYES